MIVIDTSALIAILNHEPERTALYEAIAAADRRTFVSSPQDGAQADTHPLPDQGSAPAHRQGREDPRRCESFQCQHQHDFEVGRMSINDLTDDEKASYLIGLAVGGTLTQCRQSEQGRKNSRLFPTGSMAASPANRSCTLGTIHHRAGLNTN
jgi:hypothetical protein